MPSRSTRTSPCWWTRLVSFYFLFFAFGSGNFDRGQGEENSPFFSPLFTLSQLKKKKTVLGPRRRNRRRRALRQGRQRHHLRHHAAHRAGEMFFSFFSGFFSLNISSFFFSHSSLSLSSFSLSSFNPFRPESTRATQRARSRHRRSRRSRSRRSATGRRRSRGSLRSSVSDFFDLFFPVSGPFETERAAERRSYSLLFPIERSGGLAQRWKEEEQKLKPSRPLPSFPFHPRQVCSTSSTASRTRTSTSSRPTRAPPVPFPSSRRPWDTLSLRTPLC